MAPLVTAGVSDDVTQELQMPIDPQTLDDVEEPMPARLATLKNPSTLDKIVLDQHTLTHFPSQPQCKMCVESGVRDCPHSEQSEVDAAVPQLQFDNGYMGDGGPLQIACFLVGTDTSSGAIYATMVPYSKKMDMPFVVAGTAKRVRDLECARFCLHGDKERVLQLLLSKITKNNILMDKTNKCYDKCHRHKAIKAKAPRRNWSPQCAVSCSHILGSPQRQNSVFRRDDTFTDAAVDNQTRSLVSHAIQREMRHTYDAVREDSWTEIQERDPATGRTSSRSSPRSQCQPASAAMGHRPLVGT